MVKKKFDKNLRRQKEALRAQLRTVTARTEEIAEKVKTKSILPKKQSHRLHIKEIKTDLIKTGIFVIFVIILLAYLNYSNISF